jgi:hypothetical protein
VRIRNIPVEKGKDIFKKNRILLILYSLRGNEINVTNEKKFRESIKTSFYASKSSEKLFLKLQNDIDAIAVFHLQFVWSRRIRERFAVECKSYFLDIPGVEFSMLQIDRFDYVEGIQLKNKNIQL